MENGCLERGLYFSEPHGCTWVQQMWIVQGRKRRGPGWETIPPHSSSQPFFSFLKTLKCCSFCWASQLREFTCVWARRGTQRLKPTETQSSVFNHFSYVSHWCKNRSWFCLIKVRKSETQMEMENITLLKCISLPQGSLSPPVSYSTFPSIVWAVYSIKCFNKV